MAGTEDRDPLEDYELLNHELYEYGEKLILKHKIVVANKMDLPKAFRKLEAF